MKKETLEEAAERCVLDNVDMRASYSSGEYAEFTFKEGAKWQAERMYSEEEVKFIISEALQSVLINVDLEQWFKQFNKKK
jgi:hypothetical protein